jgi:hypothetical protein
MEKFKKFAAIFIIALLAVGLTSCTKKEGDLSDKQPDNVTEVELVDVDDGDLIESSDDLLNVDYKPFYDELSKSGEWIEVTSEELGIENNKGTSSGNKLDKNGRTMSYKELFGVKKASSRTQVAASFFVWKPSVSLAVVTPSAEVNVDPVNVEPVYVPYSNGQWLNTEQGWYFQAATPVEEVTHHYGRWVETPAAGYVWVPGRVWAPAWVDWRENDQYIAWAPLTPGMFLVNDVMQAPVFYEDRYVVVEKKYFVEPSVYKYMYKENKNKIMIKEWRRIDGVMVMNKTVINKGPNVNDITTYVGHDVGLYKINKVKKYNEISVKENVVYTYKPDFKKNKKPGKNIVTKPEKFEKYTNYKGKENNKNNTGSVDDKGGNSGKDEKGNVNKDNKQPRLGDDSDMKGGKKNTNDDKSGKKNDGNVKENKGNNKDGDVKGKNNDKGNDKGKKK